MNLNLPVPKRTSRGYVYRSSRQSESDRALPKTKATTLREAVNLLDPERHLATPDERENFFVQREDSPVDKLRVILELTDKPQKILFSGHRGSGKSAELSRLAQLLEDEFIVVRFSAKRTLNLSDLTHVDVLVSIGLQLFQKAAELSEDLDLNPDLLRHVLEFTKAVSREEFREETVGTDVSAGFQALLASVVSKVSTQDTTRGTVREETQTRLKDLLDSIEDISQELKVKSERRILIVVDDLDKADLDTARDLFYKRTRALTAPSVSIIYTFPIALQHHADFIQIRDYFSQVYSLPNIKTETQSGDPFPPGLDLLQSIITRRVAPDLFTEEALDLLTRMSSGIPRELILLARQSVLEALVNDKDEVDVVSVEEEVKNRVREYDVIIRNDQRDLLRTIRKTKEIDNLPEYRALLNNLSVLEYNNGDRWYDVHPLVRRLIEKTDDA